MLWDINVELIPIVMGVIETELRKLKKLLGKIGNETKIVDLSSFAPQNL